MAAIIRSYGRSGVNHIRPAPGSYYLRGPEIREPYIPPYPPLPAPVVPPSPPSTLPVVITGEVRLEGIPYDSAVVAFSGSGSVVTDSFGTYVGTVSYGYTGTSSLSGFDLPVYTVTPSYRSYAGLSTDVAGQDFDVDINFLNISGTVTENGTGFSVPITNGAGTWATSSNGSYGYYVPYGWSGSTVPLSGSGTFSPDSYVYGPVGIDHSNQNFAFTAFAPVPPTPSIVDWTFYGPYSPAPVSNGDTMNEAFMTVNAGASWLTAGPTTHSVKNVGASPLTITDVQLAGTGWTMDLWDYTSMVPFVPPSALNDIPAGAPFLFNIVLTASGTGGYSSAVVTVTHTGSNSPYTVNLERTA